MDKVLSPLNLLVVDNCKNESDDEDEQNKSRN